MSYVYMTLSSQKSTISEKNSLTPIFTLFELSRPSHNTSSQNIGGPMHGPSPTSNFGGTVPPVPLLGLRPCLSNQNVTAIFSPKINRSRGVQPPKPMMHIAYSSPISTKFKNFLHISAKLRPIHFTYFRKTYTFPPIPAKFTFFLA